MAERPEEHPILARDRIRGDGSHTIAFRVFCARRGQSVPLNTCQDCAACLEIAADGPGADGCVRCTPAPVPVGARMAGGEPFGGARMHEGIAVGDVLTKRILCVGADLSVPALIALFVEQAMGGVFVVDDDGRLLGSIREVDFVRSRPLQDKRAWFNGTSSVDDESAAGEGPPWSAGEMMSSAIAVHEGTPVRHVILQMARSHLREAPVVTRAGELLGALRDIDGLRWIAAQARGR
jgi:CBS domain-containing protein